MKELDILKLLENESKEFILEYLKSNQMLQKIVDTPPTEEQIINELRKCEDLGCHDIIVYMPECNSFTLFRQKRVDDIFEIDLVRYENGLVYVAKHYPPYLITLIGRFYEGLQ